MKLPSRRQIDEIVRVDETGIRRPARVGHGRIVEVRFTRSKVMYVVEWLDEFEGCEADVIDSAAVFDPDPAIVALTATIVLPEEVNMADETRITPLPAGDLLVTFAPGISDDDAYALRTAIITEIGGPQARRVVFVPAGTTVQALLDIIHTPAESAEEAE